MKISFIASIMAVVAAIVSGNGAGADAPVKDDAPVKNTDGGGR